MRLKEPFRGLYLMGGHTIFHLALLIAGMITLGFPSKDGLNETINIGTLTEPKNKPHPLWDCIDTINMLRIAHGLDLFFAIIQFIGSAPHFYHKHRFTYRVLDTLKLFLYLGAVMYAIFHEQQYAAIKFVDAPEFNDWYDKAEWWILIELLVFFGQVLCSVFYLLGMQVRGEFGLDLDPNTKRYTHDALEYYDWDISWFSFVFVMWSIHLFILTTVGLDQDDNVKLFYSAFALILRSSHFYLLMPFSRDDRTFVEKSNLVWGILGVLQIIACCFIFGFKDTNGITTASGFVDFVVFIGQIMLYVIKLKENQKRQEAKDAKVDEQTQLISSQTEEKRIKKAVEHEVDSSIFDLAFVSLLDPVVMDQWQKDFPGEYLPRINLDKVEATSVFQGMLICIMIQIIAVSLLIIEFSKSIEFKSDRFLLLIPKLISCFYMHNILAEEIKDGMKIMKYTINHPQHFERQALDKDEHEGTSKEDGKYTRLTYGFLIGFIQYSIALSLEIMSIIFLNSLTSYRLIIVCYASLTAVANFDNMFAAALDSHPIKGAAGKKLRVSFHRSMGFKMTENDESAEEPSNKTQKWQKNPREGNCYLKFLRLIFKIIRMWHVSFFFYFAPFLMLFFQFYSLQKA